MKKIGTFLILFLGVAVIAALDQWLIHQWHKTKRTELSSLTKIYHNRFETTIQSRFNAAESINALFTIHPDTTPQEFAHFARILLQHNPPIRALQWADEAARVTYVFPPKGNEITLSNPMHLLSDPKRGPFVKKAVSERRATIQGPFKLRQGGMGIALRSPIFKGDRFIGLAIGIFDVPVLVREACERIEKDNLQIQLSDESGTVFKGPRHIDSNWEKGIIRVADTTWLLAVGWRREVAFPVLRRLEVWIFGGSIWLLLAVIFYTVYEQNARLARTVSLRTRQLNEKNQELSKEIHEQRRLRRQVEQQKIALRRAQKMESLGTLAGGVAHEFNNILGIVLGNAELALDDMSSLMSVKEYLQEIKTASLRGKEVGRQMLLFINRLPANKTPINISFAITEALKLVRTKISAKIEIQTDLLCEHEMILANGDDINQVFINLCTNAAHAVEANNGIVSVTLESVRLDKDSAALYDDLTPGDYAKLTVADNGTGIDSSIVERIFEPYFTTKDVGQGMGMGLAVVYGIVKNLDGAIGVQSQPGKGTSVEVVLPLITPAVPYRAEEQNFAPSGSECILLVEDNPSVLKMVALILKRLGYQVTAQSVSLQALEIFRKDPHGFDLIITDISMPDLPGDLLAREVLTIRPDIPIIMVTGHSDRLNAAKARQMGIAAYATKPLTKAELAELIRKVLDHRNNI